MSCHHLRKSEWIASGEKGEHGEPPVGSRGWTWCSAPAGIPECQGCPKNREEGPLSAFFRPPGLP